MQTSVEPTGAHVFDLEVLEFDPAPTFVIKVGTPIVAFDLLYANEAFRTSSFQDDVWVQDREALLFRSWAQALGQRDDTQHDFAGWTWSMKLAAKSGTLKIVRATRPVSKERTFEVETKKGHYNQSNTSRSPIYKRMEEEYMKDGNRNQPTSLQKLPWTNLNARWEGLQNMMEMSDVGVFEYTPEGKLIHANEAWYRLSSHPKDLPAHVDFSFMDLVYPEDQALVLTMWNKLTQGSPVTFEMRWKPRVGTNDTAQWVLSACVPIFDEDKVLISIAGNTIDIAAQKRSQEAAQARVEALEQARLSEMKFARFAQLSPTAIYIFVPETGMQFVNDQFFELTGLAHAPGERFDWIKVIADEDAERFERAWKEMLEGKKSDGVQFRLKKTWVNQDGVKSNIWVQSSSYPQTDDNGKVISIMGTLFDISQFKWAESVQSRRVKEALEAKRQQENFIDMTSHELRNPLSAVVQCAESVITTLQRLPDQLSPVTPTEAELSRFQEEISSSLDALQTIVSCSLHQKRVIDDVLTLSKLDSNLILITPVRVQPVVVISDAVKMFMVECQQTDIQLELIEDDTLKDFEWVMLDPSRLLQVLINLLTNAIKFTKDRPVRKITVKLGGSWERPPPVWHCVKFTTEKSQNTDIFNQSGWGKGKMAHIWVKVTDTGCGMTEKEQKNLFSRFTQATPRTHVKYGGSGLGLFISKSLTTLQGGAIGVSSKSNVGSTFAFFVSTRLAAPPAGHAVVRGNQGRPLAHRTVSYADDMKAVQLNVLIVEDNLVNQKVLKKQLQKCGWNVSVAGDGQEALDWLKGSVYWRTERNPSEGNGTSSTNNSPDNSTPSKSKEDLDIILMDVEMPIMDGLTCARRIRQYEDCGLLALPPARPEPRRQSSTPSLTPINGSDERIPRRKHRIPILAVSANARMEQIQQALDAGMDDAITKPFRIPELWPKMRGVIPKLADSQV